jgi:hypothetical protein
VGALTPLTLPLDCATIQVPLDWETNPPSTVSFFDVTRRTRGRGAGTINAAAIVDEMTKVKNTRTR